MMKLIPAHVDRHAVDRDGEIGAVIEQEGPIGVSLAAVRRDDQPSAASSSSPGRATGLAVIRSAGV
jgi:hypothetical protein